MVEKVVDQAKKEASVVNKNDRSCRPMTIKEVKKVKLKNEDQYLLGKHEITNVAIVGIVRSITKQDTHTTYAIEDGTGAIDVKYWSSIEGEEGFAGALVADLDQNTYVKVIGRLRILNQYVTLIAAFIRPIRTPDEISFHFLDTVYTHLYTRTILDVYFNKETILKDNTKNVVKRVIQLHAQHADGVKIQSIVSHLKNTINESKIMEAIEHLSLEGEIYNTTEDVIKLIE